MPSQHSPRFATVQRYYQRGLWGIERVANAVAHGWITAEEYEEITGVPYPVE